MHHLDVFLSAKILQKIKEAKKNNLLFYTFPDNKMRMEEAPKSVQLKLNSTLASAFGAAAFRKDKWQPDHVHY